MSSATAAGGGVAAAPPAGGGDSVVVRAAGLGKRFKLYRNPWHRAAEWLTLGRATLHSDFWALSDVSFDVRRGECLGVIGPNGSGKSTLLKMLSGAMHPTAGTFAVRGRVLSLLELGTGLNPELTGRDNVIQGAELLGFPPGYGRERVAEIEAFAELGADFFDRPVRTYSSGMFVRLAFAMFASFEPDVFIVDEALSVGDVMFQQKCVRRIDRMRSAGVTMLLVTHDLALVEALCDRVVVLQAGRVRHDGDKQAGVRMYYALGGRELAKQPTGGAAGASAGPAAGGGGAAAGPPPIPFDPDALPWQRPDARDASGDGQVDLVGVCFRRADGSPEPVVRRGEWIDVYVDARAAAAAPATNIGLTVYDRTNRLVWARGWVNADRPPFDLAAGDRAVARFAVKLDLEPGEYIVCCTASQALADPAAPAGWNQHVGGARYRELPRAAVVAVLPPPDNRRASFGPANLDSRIDGGVAPAAAPPAGPNAL